MSEQPAGAARTPGDDPIAPESEARRISPFVTWSPGFGSVDPADPNKVVFEDFSPRILDASASDEVYLEPAVLTVPKGSSAPEPAPFSESPPVIEPPRSETPVPPVAPSNPSTPSLGPLPFPMSPNTEVAETDDGSLSPSEAG